MHAGGAGAIHHSSASPKLEQIRQGSDQIVIDRLEKAGIRHELGKVESYLQRSED